MEKNTSSGTIYGHGKLDGSVTGFLLADGTMKLYPMLLMTSGKLYINFRDCMKPPFDAEPKRIEFLEKLNLIPGVKLPTDCIARQPFIPLSILTGEGQMDRLLRVMDWFAGQLH
ncbi:hypothetical protein [Tunturiibacter gelidiferens]|uniref:hypothetical protein n=1 Tax=Tunturiibacter gelidiferens TaxID=3069689 RepID=UPI003D9B43AA